MKHPHLGFNGIFQHQCFHSRGLHRWLICEDLSFSISWLQILCHHPHQPSSDLSMFPCCPTSFARVLLPKRTTGRCKTHSTHQPHLYRKSVTSMEFMKHGWPETTTGTHRTGWCIECSSQPPLVSAGRSPSGEIRNDISGKAESVQGK